MSVPPAVELLGIHKRFGAVRALEGADLVVEPGEVHGVLGENGAGKTTLLTILAGGHAPDAGEVRVHGRTVRFRTPREAWAGGVGMVHQHFALVPRLTVLENLALGRPLRSRGITLALGRVRARAEEIARATGLTVPFARRVEELGVGDRQRAEIFKVLIREPDVLVLDEPTAVLTPSEVETLLSLLRRLAAGGRAVVLIAHKLDEVLAVADRVTVLRRGRTVLLRAHRAEVDAGRLADAMVGGSDEADEASAPPPPPPTAAPSSAPPPPRAAPSAARAERARVVSRGAVVARLAGVTVRGGQGEPALRGIDLHVRPGEIVGIAGVEGNGQRELARVLAGRLAADAGEARVPEATGYVPQDRRREGLVPTFTIAENLALAWHDEPAAGEGAWLDWPGIRTRAAELMATYDVRAAGPDALAGTLSGGNQQRVVLARELSGRPALLVAENPTRGLDVAGTAFVHGQLRALRGRRPDPPGIVLVSTDLDEVLALADRVLVLVRGRLEPVPESERSREAVGRRMLVGAGAEGATGAEGGSPAGEGP